MYNDEGRARFLSDRVLTATPAQRIVMLYDRLLLDLGRGSAMIADGRDAEAGPHIGHAMQIVIELQTSLDRAAGDVAENLAALYGYLIGQLIAIRGGAHEHLPAVSSIVSGLRESWSRVAEGDYERAGAPAALSAAPVGGAWVG